jgi:Reverse transcriptase (RNA-dependent DNA polymerase)
MSPASISAILDLDLAWRRVQSDHSQRRTFVRHPFLEQAIEVDRAAWQASVAHAIDTGAYKPSPCKVCSVPKPRGLIRPGADLTIEDQVVYAALLQQMRPQISTALFFPDGSPDYSYGLRSNTASIEWFEPHFPRWKAFDADSIALLDAGATHVVVADIAGYYELVDLNTLGSDLNAIGVDANCWKLLMDQLHRWSRVQRRGIPQGYSPSDILGKLYLNAVDRTLQSKHLRHKRWVDDFRIFCNSEAEARDALVTLIGVLARRGLVVQSAKTQILTAQQARKKFGEIPALLKPIQERLLQQLLEAGWSGRQYPTSVSLDEALAALADSQGVDAARNAYDDYFVRDSTAFNKTLFRYLLSRLGAARDSTHVDHIVAQLRDHPEEFEAIASYVARVSQVAKLEKHFVPLRAAGLVPYEYLLYQLFRWRLRLPGVIENDLLALARQMAFTGSASWYLRGVARAVIGMWGEPADLEQLEDCYPTASSEVEKVEIVCALQRMEPGRRNAFFGRASGDGDSISRAVRMTRAGSVRFDAC